MSKIEWTEKTWNPIVGCSIVSPGCTNCYAMKQAARIEKMNPGLAHYRGLTQPSKAGPVWTGKIALSERALLEPLRRRTPTTWFVNSMGDLFHEDVPDEWIDRVFAVMALCPQHTFQILTKRSRRMREYCSNSRRGYQIARHVVDFAITKTVRIDEHWPVVSEGDIDTPDDIRLREWPLPNVWLGVSAEDQRRADERVPDLLATPAAVRFVSCEPLLSAVDLSKWMHDGRRESISGAGRFRAVQGRGRQDLAAREMDRRRGCFRTDLHAKDPSGEKFSALGQLLARDVQGWIGSQEGERTSDHLDDREPSPDSGRDGSEPFGREQAEQRSVEFGDRHASAERTALTHAPFAEEEGPARREEFIRSSDGRTGDGNPSTVEGESDDATRNRGNVRRQAIDDFSDRCTQELGASSLDWIIVGGESGPNARPMQVPWARSIVQQCKASGVACFVKQLGADPIWEDGAFLNLAHRKGADMAEWPDDLRVREVPDATA